MNDMIEAAQAIEKMGVTSILAGITLVEALIIRVLWKVREECIEKLVRGRK